MPNNNYRWMKYAIKLSSKANGELIRVSAVLVNNNKLVDYSFSNNENNISWAEDLIIKLNKKNIKNIENLYLTINTINNKKEFDLNKLLNKIKIENIYLGLPDPKLNVYLENDPVLKHKNIYRFTEDLQEEILKLNQDLYSNSKQNIKYCKYYYNNRISSFVKRKLKTHGIELETDEILLRRQIDKLSSYISKKYHMTTEKNYELITNILSEAFDHKYSKYNYLNDIRSINTNWSKEFKKIYTNTNNKPLNKMKILNVGVGSGKEATELFLDCNDITFVDIAPHGLENIKKSILNAKTIQERAENLSILKDNSYDLYVSLRTYNSSFFNINEAIKEAYRILKNNATIIISISNGFLDTEEKRIIPGIIIPKLNFVDLYRGLDITRDLSNILSNYNFEEIKLTPTKGEIYISAKVKK